MEFVSKYLTEVMTTLQTGSAREHAYRPAFQQLIKSIKPELQVVNDPARSEHGAPDFVFLKGELTFGYTETKDIGVDLDKVEKGEQMQRYFGYSNLILTDYLEFRFFRNGERYTDPIKIGTLSGGVIVPNEKDYELLERTIKDFLGSPPEKIKSGARLAKIMGGKARRIRENVSHYIAEKSEKSAELLNVYEVIRKLLVHDLQPDQFADMYAQTLVYGLFVARYHDETPDTFSRAEARDLIPKSNPLLQHFFDHIAGASFDKRLAYIVNELCEIFAVVNVKSIMEQYYSRTTLWGETKESPDPVIHFYEDFLKEYDSDQRVKLGAFYTPLPVVKFIVRGVDYLLKKELGLTQGLADTSKKEFIQQKQGLNGRVLLHQVQILDPATGTGTFLNEVVKHIHKSFEDQQGRWTSYVDNDLLPRLHGFELMMAPYTIAHLKLGMTLRDMGYEKFSKRLGIYLTNSLEAGLKERENLFTSLGFMKSVAEESKDASIIKNEKPIMVVIGNPPYSGESSNVHFTNNNVYKTEPSGGKLQERNSKWLNDDYVKFIRLAESLIEKNSEGIVAMITAHGYLDNPTFRGMRYHLMQTFDAIYVVNLHGNANKSERTKDGGKDENVFNIKQGVSIIFGIKKSKSKKLAKVFRADCLGTRKSKFDYLNTNSIESIVWSEINLSQPNYEWVARDNKIRDTYQKGFSVSDLFNISSVGIVTSRDSFVIDSDKHVLAGRIQDFLNFKNPQDAKSKFNLKENKSWKIVEAQKHYFDEKNIISISYRPFDSRFIYFHDDFIERSRKNVMKNYVKNIVPSLVALRQVKAGNTYQHIFISNKITESTLISNKTSEIDYVFPLYLYHEDGTKTVNFNNVIQEKIKSDLKGEVKPEDILDYIYAVLHSPNYRKKYKEFLKIDFPRVPYPKNNENFWKLVEKGRELRSLHLMESPKLVNFITTFPESGLNVVGKVKYEDDKAFINETQYFGNVPEVAWSFYIGGYQPAQKWLKDRKGRTLLNEDLEHYQKMIVALVETDRIMKEIDKFC